MLYGIECGPGASAEIILQVSSGKGQIACVDGEGAVAFPGPVLVPWDDSPDSGSPVESFMDGHVLGWGVALAMAAAWGIHILRRAAT